MKSRTIIDVSLACKSTLDRIAQASQSLKTEIIFLCPKCKDIGQVDAGNGRYRKCDCRKPKPVTEVKSNKYF
jgi:histidinol phosphatase-like enzyme